jgi:hypothetical protein
MEPQTYRSSYLSTRRRRLREIGPRGPLPEPTSERKFHANIKSPCDGIVVVSDPFGGHFSIEDYSRVMRALGAPDSWEPSPYDWDHFVLTWRGSRQEIHALLPIGVALKMGYPVRLEDIAPHGVHGLAADLVLQVPRVGERRIRALVATGEQRRELPLCATDLWGNGQTPYNGPDLKDISVVTPKGFADFVPLLPGEAVEQIMRELSAHALVSPIELHQADRDEDILEHAAYELRYRCDLVERLIDAEDGELRLEFHPFGEVAQPAVLVTPQDDERIGYSTALRFHSTLSVGTCTLPFTSTASTVREARTQYLLNEWRWLEAFEAWLTRALETPITSSAPLFSDPGSEEVLKRRLTNLHLIVEIEHLFEDMQELILDVLTEPEDIAA